MAPRRIRVYNNVNLPEFNLITPDLWYKGQEAELTHSDLFYRWVQKGGMWCPASERTLLLSGPPGLNNPPLKSHKLMLSNLAPSPEEEAILRACLRTRSEDLAELHSGISKAQAIVTSTELLIDQLSRVLAWAQKTLAAHFQADKCFNLPQSSYRTVKDAFGLVEMSSTVSHQSLKALSALLGDNAGRNNETLTNHLDFTRILGACILSLEDDLRRQRLVVNVTSTSLRLYSLEKDIIKSDIKMASENLGAVRRIPNEIWYDILGIRLARDSHWYPNKKDKGLHLPALSLSHVCRTWRQVILSSSQMWRSIHWNLARNQTPNQNLINLWTERAQKSPLRIYERMAHSVLPTGAFTHKRLGLAGHHKLQYYLHQDKNLPEDLGDNLPTSNCSTLVLRASKQSKRVQTVQKRLIKMFPALTSLRLENVVPRRVLTPPKSLTLLAISFSGPNQTYSLANLLNERLTYLKLIHFDGTGVPTLEHTIALPNLTTLQVTPFEHNIAANLELPQLETLRISPPQSAFMYCPGWLDSLITHCARLTSLCLDLPSTQQSTLIASWDRLGILRYLCVHAHKLRTVKFNGGFISGGALADFFERDLQGNYNTIEELSIDGCTGVSRMDCDRLVPLVSKLNVYYTVHGELVASDDDE